MEYSFHKLKWLSHVVYTPLKLMDSVKKLPIASHRLYNAGRAASAKPAAPAPGTGTEGGTPTLRDLLGRRHNYLRISLTERCNLRCQYCMPAEGVPLSGRGALLSRAELAALVRALAVAGVDKLRLTGGEPTLRPDLADIIQELSAIPGIGSVSMTTNGLVLTRRLVGLQRAGLAAINVSLDSLRAERYERMARRPGLARVLAGVDLALQLAVPVKINVVLIKGFNDDEICDFVEFTKDREVEVRFIEFMPFSGNKWEDARLVPYREALRVIRARHAGLQPRPTRPHDTAKVWRVPGYAGSVGFISSMTQHFCSTCNRLRLTADGNLKVCLFGAAEVSLRDALRGGADGDEIRALVRRALAGKRASHAGECRHAEPRAHGEPAHDPHRWLASASCFSSAAAVARLGGARLYSTRARDSHSDSDSEWEWESESAEAGPFSHLDSSGCARMVDVSQKAVTRRLAVAACRVLAGAPLLELLRGASPASALHKGDALGVARVAGTLAAKRTADLIPLCHPLQLDAVRVRLRVRARAVHVQCAVRVTARTGAEMEALTGCAVAALALYDMCKAVDKDMRITDLRLLHKEGGRTSPRTRAPSSPAPRDPSPTPSGPRDPAPSPSAKETFAPTNLIHF